MCEAKTQRFKKMKQGTLAKKLPERLPSPMKNKLSLESCGFGPGLYLASNLNRTMWGKTTKNNFIFTVLLRVTNK
jgi:hypothetical protein